jgi:predicted RNA-binding protein YlxR (DUF448 family)
MSPTPRIRKRTRTRTCVGCGKREAATRASGLVRIVAREAGLEVDLSGCAAGRGAYVHARPTCLAQASRGLTRSLGIALGSTASGSSAAELASRLTAACHRRIAELLLTARRIRAIRPTLPSVSGTDDARLEPLTIVAVDAGSAASSSDVQRAIAVGRAFAWGTRADLGVLLGTMASASCAVGHPSLAAELIRTRAAADAASVAIQETTQRSRRPEAR